MFLPNSYGTNITGFVPSPTFSRISRIPLEGADHQMMQTKHDEVFPTYIVIFAWRLGSSLKIHFLDISRFAG